MIIFELEDTLADCNHRRHFVDASFRNDCVLYLKNTTAQKWVYKEGLYKPETRKYFEPDWKSFYEACDRDLRVKSAIKVFINLLMFDNHLEIWSGRCDSTKEKTNLWLKNNIYDYVNWEDYKINPTLKMRPEGLDCPQERLFEYFLFQSRAEEKKRMKEGEWISSKDITFNHIEMAFLSHKPTIDLFRSHGIFVFDCRQNENN